MKRKVRQSGIAHLRMLPLGIRDRVIYNVSVRHKESTWKVMTGRYDDMRDFINGSMIWADTREGREFWSCLHDHGVRKTSSKYKELMKTVPLMKP